MLNLPWARVDAARPLRARSLAWTGGNEAVPASRTAALVAALPARLALAFRVATMTAARAFVTGGTGFLGLNLIEQLVAAGW